MKRQKTMLNLGDALTKSGNDIESVCLSWSKGKGGRVLTSSLFIAIKWRILKISQLII